MDVNIDIMVFRTPCIRITLPTLRTLYTYGDVWRGAKHLSALATHASGYPSALISHINARVCKSDREVWPWNT